MALPVLFGILPEPYYSHLKLFIHGITLLSSNSISNDEILEADICLKYFVKRFEELYGLRNMTMNLHLLLHLAENVRKNGPLWCTSCFPYEDINGKLKFQVKSSNAAHLQIYSSINLIININFLKDYWSKKNSPIIDLCNKILFSKKKIKLEQSYGQHIYCWFY